MGKKATLLLTQILFEWITALIAILTIVGWFAGIVSPQKSYFISLMSLGMLPLLVVNFLFLVIWAFKRSFWVVVPLAAILTNIGFIISMVQVDFRSQDKIPAPDIKVATYNIHGYTHPDFVKFLGNITTYMQAKGMDILCLQEFVQSNEPDLDSVLRAIPHYIINTESEAMQIAIFSKYPITDSKIIKFKNSANSAMWVDIQVDGRKIRVFNIHLQTTNFGQSQGELSKIKTDGIGDLEGKKAFDIIVDRMGYNSTKRAGQVSLIRHEIENTKDRMIIVCGDFNDTPASYAYRQIKKGLDDDFRTCGSGYGYTFQPFRNLLRIDYIMHSKEFKGVRYYSESLMWSDHNPVFLELAF